MPQPRNMNRRNSIAFSELAEDLKESIDERRKCAPLDDAAVADICRSFVAKVCGAAEGLGDVKVAEQVRRIMPHIVQDLNDQGAA